MRRFLPKSLLGQMLLAVALALLVAQALSAVLLYRAEQQRSEAGIVNALAFQLIAEPRRERGRERMRRRAVRTLENADIREGWRAPGREAALRSVLEREGVVIAELVVVIRPPDAARALAAIDGLDAQRIRPWLERDSGVVFAGLKREGEDRWRIARVPQPPPGSRALRGIVLQTLILYLVLVGGLALLLRRLTRPLAALTKRVETFGGMLDASLAPLQPEGPQDARRLISAHNAMEARIAALLDEKNVMLGAIGHDLKTPLAALRVRIEGVEDDAERERMAATIEDITSSLDDILSLARVGRPTDPVERTDLSALVAGVVEEYEDMGEDVALGRIDKVALPLRATWLRRAIRNLVGNALRYGKRARIAVLHENGSAVIRVADAGPGIPEDSIAAMLEPFARGETSRNRETGGAGLGLTLARAIAEQHGGTLTLANRIGENSDVEGLLAEISLPLG
ncbi:sensor histidine kinase [Aurantiacibacter aquimixticola]|uniref:histidine kinase n=1 Tax=Aurantiacibacter aquimixticola TaxID=1958945 RepID=A0A419RUF2_9SPHN|nr:ATP-binding protein [Aurantiacibacter aquimixticola]RJY09409.1 two-component sensor histidine kinase [Aurantiacibacter aquimixticola]